MNILLVTMEMNIGGAETHVLELARALKKRNNNVIVVSAGGKLAQELEKSDIEHIYAPLKDKKITHILTSISVIKKAIIEKNIDVVHAHARIPGAICGYICKKTKTHFVTTVHGIYKVNFILKKLTNWGEKTLAVSEDIKNQVIRDYNLNEKNVFVTVNGINLENYKKDRINSIDNIKLDENKLKLIHVSRLDEDTKEIASLLIGLADEIDNEIPGGVQTLIIGSGNAYEYLENLAKDKKNVVLIKGPRTDVNKILNLGDVFVGVSRCALEAMASELPVILAGNIANNQGYLGILNEENLKTAIDTNFTCRGLPRTDKNNLKNDILKLLQNDNSEIGKNNRRIVEENYSIDKMTEDAIKVYTF